ncbi:DUF2474 domain-containing protein [Acidovorax sp. YS12]|jgi:hypothetical protein|nr:DUF2474 domain-containing protein [Acidovorax sp. YS12]
MKHPVSPTYGWGKRLIWLVAIWTCSITALGAMAWVMRMIMRAAGMAS